jgi:hypothetical protein
MIKKTTRVEVVLCPQSQFVDANMIKKQRGWRVEGGGNFAVHPRIENNDSTYPKSVNILRTNEILADLHPRGCWRCAAAICWQLQGTRSPAGAAW